MLATAKSLISCLYKVAELCQVQYLVPEVQGTFCTLYRLVSTRYFQVPCTCSPVQGTFEYLVPTSRYKVLLSTLYLPPDTRYSTGSGTNRYMVKSFFQKISCKIMATLRRLILMPKDCVRKLCKLSCQLISLGGRTLVARS